MGLPPTARNRVYGPEKDEWKKADRIKANIAEALAPEDGLTESERPLTHDELEVESIRFFKKSCGKSIRAWRNKKTFMFVRKPHYVE